MKMTWPDLTLEEAEALTEDQREQFWCLEYPERDRLYRHEVTAEAMERWQKQLDAEGWPVRSGRI